MIFGRTTALVAAMVVFASLTPATVDAAPSFQGLGHLPGGEARSYAFAASADGSVVVGSSGSNAFRWTARDGMVALIDRFGAPLSGTPRGVSADGSVIVGTAYEVGAPRAFRWTESGGQTILPARSVDAQTYATSVSDDGRVTVGYSYRNDDGYRSALLWGADGAARDLGGLTTTRIDSFADGVSADGSVVVGTSWTGSGLRPIRWTAAGGMTLLGGTFLQPAYDVTPDGSVVVGTNFRWTQTGGYRQLLYGTAFGVAADGNTVVGGLEQAFLWDGTDAPPRLLKDILEDDFGLDLTGWTLRTAQDISNDGTTIVGWATNPAGQTEAFIAVIPEPVSVLLAGIPCVLTVLRRRR